MRYNLRSKKREAKPDEEDSPPVIRKRLRKRKEPFIEKTLGESEPPDSDGGYDSLDDFIEDEEEDTPKRLLELLMGKTNEKRKDEWQEDLDEYEVEVLEQELNEIREEMESKKPSIPKILKSRLCKKEKSNCVRWYDLWEKFPSVTEESHAYNKLINKTVKKGVDAELNGEKSRIKKMVIPERTLEARVLLVDAPDEIKCIIYSKYKVLQDTDEGSSNYAVIKEWLYWALRIPYRKKVEILPSGATPDVIVNKLQHIKHDFDEKLFGLDRVKEEMLHQLNNHFTSSKDHSKGCILSLKGPSGVGKTLCSRVLAESLGLPFYSVSLAGLEDATLLKGSDNVWVGSSPSVFVQALVRMGCSNGVLLLDEVDKLFTSRKSNACQHALLQPLDYTTNHCFEDMMLKGLPIDLSGLIIVCAMNDDRNIDQHLLNRISPIIEIKPYTSQEKKIIIKKFIILETLKQVGMKEGDVAFTPSALDHLLYLTKDEKGVREVKVTIQRVISRVNMLRTCFSESSKESKLKLSYDLKNFNFPLVITTTILNKLYQKDTQSDALFYFS